MDWLEETSVFDRLVLALGAGRALALCRTLGGTHLYMPAKFGKNKLGRFLTEKEFKKMQEFFYTGERLFLPNLKSIIRPILTSQIQEERDSGVKLRFLEKRHRLSSRQLKRILK